MRAAAVMLAAVLALPGCSATGQLVAPSGEHRMTARDDDSGVTIVLTTGVWSGEPADLERSTTVIHALVANLGPSPILLAPGDLELRDVRRFRYALLDPGASFERVDEPDTPAASSRYDRELQRSYDPGRTLEFQPLLADGDVPRLGLPWGVLEPGTQMRGFLYFEPFVRSADGGELRWHIGTPDHQPLFDARFALAVASR